MKINLDALWIDHSTTISLQPEIETIIIVLMNLFDIEE